MESPSSVSREEPKESGAGFIEFEGDISEDIDIPNDSRIMIVSRHQSYLTHGIHKFPAKFFPELPRYLIRRYSERGGVVLDPMCGSGTAVLEALLNDREVIGIDIDPLARLITKVKTTPIPAKPLRSATDLLLVEIARRVDCGQKPNLPVFNYRDNWFRDFVLSELATILECINEKDLWSVENFSSRTSVQDVHDFFRVAFSSIIRSVSNADPHCTRTVIRKRLTKTISPGDVVRRFAETLSQQVLSLADFNSVYSTLNVRHVELPKTDALHTGLEDGSVDLAITSPPYINAVDYPRTHQLELYWLGLLTAPLSAMKREYIGTETVYKSEYSELKSSGMHSLDPVLRAIFDRDPRRSYITYRFFEDMTAQLREVSRVLRSGGRYCIAIGNNQIRGVEVPSHEILAEIAASSRVGFELERRFFSGLIRHFIRIPRKERMQGEWVLVLRKP